MRYQQHTLGQVGYQPGRGVKPRGSVHYDVTVVRRQHVEQAHELCGCGFLSRGDVSAGQQLQTTTMTGHEAFQQGGVHPVEVAGGVGDGKQRLQVQMQRRVAEGSQIHQSSISVGRVQGQG